MSPKEVEQFRQLLTRQQAELQGIDNVLSESGQTVELDQTRVGRLSRMDALQGQQMALEAKRRQKQKLLAIGAALRRIETEAFGWCLECGEEEDIRRLQADPSSALCIECAD